VIFAIASRARAQAPEAPPPESALAEREGRAEPAPPPSEAPVDSAAPLIPPRLVDAPDPDYPESHLGLGIEPVVELHVTVEPDGAVSDAHVEHAGDPEFDRAAVEAVRRWRFEPARRGDRPVRARVRVAVRFRRPRVAPEPVEQSSEGEPALGATASRGSGQVREPAGDGGDHAFGARAIADPTEESRASRAVSDFRIGRDVIEAAPRGDASDLLRLAPGVFSTRAEGDAVAPEITLRGFDAAHGQDIELLAGGIPLNQPSHVHGQGYAELGWLIPEVVRGLRVTEGVYDPRQGNFATAGTIEFDLGVERRGLQLRTTYGSFETFRALLLWAPSGEREETFGAATFRTTSGFGRNRAGQSGGAIAQWVFGNERVRARVHGAIAGARYGLAGVLRRDDLQAGRVGWFDVYDDPGARAQHAFSARAHLGVDVQTRRERGSFMEIGAWLAYADFRELLNFSGYVERSQIMPAWSGRGDLIEQRNEDVGLGLRMRYRTERFDLARWLRGFFEVGLVARLDLVGQSQNLLQAPQNETWDRRVDADVREADVGAFLDLDWRVTDHVRLRGGLRVDVLYFDVDDRLGNFVPAFRRADYLLGLRRTALGVAAGPRATVEVTPIPELTLSLAYGEGYRSPQARQLQEGESAPFAKVRSGDLGARLRIGGDDGELVIGTAGYLTHVSDDVAFDPREARLEAVGPTTRVGGVLYVEARPVVWLLTSASVTFVQATLDSPPPATAEMPNPPYRPGQLLAYVPPWVVRADVAARERLFDLDGRPLRGRIGAGFSFLSPRPLPHGQFADPVALLDAGASVEWSPLEMGVDVLNLTDARWAANEFVFASNWSSDAIPSRLPARHVAAGPPLTVMVYLGVML
jgi:TonB family protein